MPKLLILVLIGHLYNITLYFIDKFPILQGKLKAKRLHSMVQSLGPSDLGPYGGGSYTSPSGQTVKLDHIPVSKLVSGSNPNKVIVGRVVGSVPMDDPVP